MHQELDQPAASPPDHADAAGPAAPHPAEPAPAGADLQPKPDPTRYGDWEKNGRCIDF